MILSTGVKDLSAATVTLESYYPKSRRTVERIRVSLNARWQGFFEQHEASVCDISVGGCFVLSEGEVSTMELIQIEIQLPTGDWVCLWGQVVYCCEEIGFGLRFARAEGEALGSIEHLVSHVSP